jgi:type-F conjugative transfer system pilin assembly protein TrbC
MLKLALNIWGLKRLELYDGKLSRTVLRGWERWQHPSHYPTLVPITKLTMILLVICMAILPVSLSKASTLGLEQKQDKEQSLGGNLQQQARDMTWQYLVGKLKETRVYGEDLTEGLIGSTDSDDNRNSQYDLKIFVSSSMPISLVKTYAMEAKKYGGTLIFKGLPNGSFKALQQLVMSMGGDNEKEEPCAMQIDQEAFEYYAVERVPTIVLAQSGDCFEGQSCRSVFDKMTGNVGIKFALVSFKERGELRSLAGEILGQ